MKALMAVTRLPKALSVRLIPLKILSQFANPERSQIFGGQEGAERMG